MSKLIYSAVIISPLGKIGFTVYDNKLSGLTLLPETVDLIQPDDAFSKEVASQLLAYFTCSKHTFDLDFHLDGTVFQKHVWHALQDIPTGKRLTYGTLAKKLQTSPRAIGQACRTNPIPIIIPCHRVIAATHLGGYSGATSGKQMEVKSWLLHHEFLSLPRQC
ncbi:MAG: methylated-DNA--[protein]-cysteine S-methyltransferase [Gammaproteobacteria bacterium]|nr:methylated-DNA--[protein]-cysteine S-methyltransferase [Gammaproteobacteria bacterium]MCW5582915.1 methylated-DNA--[protein]-cysteine S-methyltransferase [Gammaproteobacteria bacterium]